ncbi:MAG: hypothetical protein RBU37_14920 [Myxococcota bacterium]|nr:hypothetical protein [Myxococcota bacterium]
MEASGARLDSASEANNLGEQAKRPIDKKLGEQAKRPIDKKLGEQAKRPIDKRPKMNGLRALLLLVLTLAPGLSTEAWAWDPALFLQQQEDAHQLFLASDYGAALQRYEDAHGMLEAALERGELPEEQRPAANNALRTIEYQLARCLQLTDECARATESFQSLLEAEAVLPDVKAKLPLRLAESMLCSANQAANGGDFDEAEAHLAAANEQAQVAAASSSETVLSKADRPVFQEELEAVKAAIETRQLSLSSEREAATLRAAQQELDAIETLLSQGACEPAQVRLEALSLPEMLELRERQDALLLRHQSECGLNLSYVAWGLGAGGAALLVADLIFEGVLLGTASDFEDARASCLRGNGQCKQAVELSEELDTGRMVSAVLLGSGLALITASVIWLFLDTEDESDSSMGVWTQPNGGGLSFTLLF